MGCCASAEPTAQPPAPTAVGVPVDQPPNAMPDSGPVFCATPASNLAKFRSTGLVAEHYFGVHAAQGGVPHAQPLSPAQKRQAELLAGAGMAELSVPAPVVLPVTPENSLSFMSDHMATFRATGLTASTYFSVVNPALSPAGKRQMELLDAAAERKEAEAEQAAIARAQEGAAATPSPEARL